MEYTREQVQRFKKEFSVRRRRQWLATGIPILMFVTMFFGRAFVENFGVPEIAITGSLILLVLGVVVFSLFNWRCPACSGHLGRVRNPRFCSMCGAPLRD